MGSKIIQPLAALPGAKLLKSLTNRYSFFYAFTGK